jgi:hypothetical protein
VRGDPKPHGVYDMLMRSEMCFFDVVMWCGICSWDLRCSWFVDVVMWCDIYIYIYVCKIIWQVLYTMWCGDVMMNDDAYPYRLTGPYCFMGKKT